MIVFFCQETNEAKIFGFNRNDSFILEVFLKATKSSILILMLQQQAMNYDALKY